MRRSGRPYRRLIDTVKARPDGWTCCRCHQPIDPSLRWPHKRSWSLDHVVPLSLGGSLLDPASRAAHLTCNAKHGRSLQNKPILSRAW